MIIDKRDVCGCHKGCTWPPGGDSILGIPGHDCATPCRWPDCLTAMEAAELPASWVAAIEAAEQVNDYDGETT